MDLTKLSRIGFIEAVQDYEADLVKIGEDADEVVRHTNILLDEIINDASQPENLRENASFYKVAAVRINRNHKFNQRMHGA